MVCHSEGVKRLKNLSRMRDREQVARSFTSDSEVQDDNILSCFHEKVYS